MSVFNVNANLNEYVFARMVEDYNVGVRQSGGEYISASKGRALHDKWLDAVGQQAQDRRGPSGQWEPVLDSEGNQIPCTLDTIRPSQVRVAFQQVFSPLDPNNATYSDIDAFNDKYNSYLAEWVDVTGIALRGAEAAKRKTEGMKFSTDNVIPCSPFDERYAERETILEHGTEILYRNPSDVFVPRQISRDGRMEYVFVDRDLPIEAERQRGDQFLQMRFRKEDGTGRAPADERTSVYELRNAGPVATIADASGLSRLRGFMTDKEFREASRWMEQVPEDRRMTRQMTDRSIAILEHLDETGTQYSIRPDTNPGQLKAVIDRTKVSIRLTDTRQPGATDRQNGLYIGRVYNDGNSLYLTARSKADRDAYTPSIDDTLKLVDYAMGRSVDRPASLSSSGGKVGTISTRRARGAGNEDERTTFMRPKKGSPEGKLEMQFSFGTVQNPINPTRRDARGREVKNNMFLGLNSSNNHSDAHLMFETKEAAEDFLRDAISSARDNFEQRINLDHLIEEHHNHPLNGEPDDPNESYIPDLSGDPTIAPAQLTYWNVLRGRLTLNQPDGSQTFRDNDPVFAELFESMNLTEDRESDSEIEDDELSAVPTSYNSLTGQNTYVGTPEQNIRAHLRDSVDMMFGQFEPNADGLRFSPSLVAQFMEGPHGVPRNKDNLVSAMRTLEFTGKELLGNDFETGTMQDKLLRFDEASAEPLVEKAKTSEYLRVVLDTMVTSLRETACKVDPNDIKIDKMGVIRYDAQVAVGTDVNKFVPLQGEIGQVFEPDEYGLVETHYNGSKNKLFTPGYDAYIAPDDGTGQSIEERYRFRGLPQVLVENIQNRIRYDVQNVAENVPSDLSAIPDDMVLHTGTTTSINNTYRGLYTTGYKIMIEPEVKENGEQESLKETYLRQMAMTNMPEDRLQLIFKTNRRLCHLPKELIEESSVNAEYRFAQREKNSDFVSVHELTNDNGHDWYNELGHKNFAITAENSDRLFDPVMSGSGKNQGAIRYFMVGAGVNIDGTPHFSDNPNGRAPIMYAPEMQYASNIPADRQQMAVSNLMTGSGIAGAEMVKQEDGTTKLKGVGVAFLTIGGYTYDDGAVISKDLAEKYQQLDENGKLRPLMPGDKICDSSGNKSIVGLVVDRNMDPAEAEKRGLTDIVELFKNNPTLDIVQSPYSPCSRFNAAAAKFGLESHEDLKLSDDRVVEGGIAYMPVTITHHTAEDHTKSYDDDDVKQGKGRKVSAQQGWMLTAKGAPAMMAEYYGPNSSAVTNLREYMNTLGWDFSETGDVRFGYKPHNGEERYPFHMPDDATLANIESKDLGKLFADTVGSRGGFMELPFPLEQMASNPETGVSQKTEPIEGVERNGHAMYALPVMSSHLRSGQTFEDGTKMTHDYTNQYQRIYENGVKYLKAEADLATAGTDADKEKCRKAMSDAQRSAQQDYNGIMDDVYARILDTKHNLFRDSVMARRMSKSATAVWTPDPSLDLNQVSLSPGLSDKLGVKDGDRVLIARDPLLRTYGMRYMDVKVDPELHGCAVNPAIAVSFDGDFDGDSVAIQSVQTDAAKEEAYRLFSFDQNMLDFSRVRGEKDASAGFRQGDYALMFNDSMDVISNEEVDNERRAETLEKLKAQYGEGTDAYKSAVDALPETLRERRIRLEREYNDVYRDTSLSAEDRMQKNKDLMRELSDYTKDVFKGVGSEALSFKSPEALMQSLITVVDHKAKGSMGKLNSYMQYAGFTADHDADGRILPESVKVSEEQLVTQQNIRDVEKSTAIKAHCTGNAGAVSQRMVSFLRNKASEFEPEQPNAGALESGLRLSYLATQGILQAKHDPVKAQILEDKVNADIRNLWRGYSMEKSTDDKGVPHWRVAYDRGTGKPIQATRDEWVKTFMEVHEDKKGLDLGGSVSREDVERVADAMVGPDGRMLNIEDPQVISKYVSPVDQLAYYQTDGRARDLLNSMAQEGRNLYEGSASYQFAPEQIRRNMQLAADGHADEMKAIQPSDTRMVHNTIDVRNSAVDLSVESEGDVKAFRGKDVSTSAGFDPAAKAAAAGKGSTFKYDFTKTAEAPVTDTEKSSAPTDGKKMHRELPDISGVKGPEDLQDGNDGPNS